MTGPAVEGPAVPALALRGRLAELDDGGRRLLLERATGADDAVRRTVAEILVQVQVRGDAALLELARRLDGVEQGAVEVPRADWDAALASLRADDVKALREAARAIESAHRAWLPSPVETRPRPGVTLGRRPVPLRRVGAYAPGGRAAYPSSVLMCVIPARVAGVDEVVVCSPPGADGRPSPAVLAACAIAGADRLFAAGGAGAVAAMAFGTATVPAVDKIVGPGSVWVEEAKQQVSGTVAVDCPAGPSEVLVIADGDADAEALAAELLAQAEHDPRAAAVLLSTDPGLADRVAEALGRGLAALSTAPAAAAALATRGAILVCDDLAAALAFAEEYAPEHLLLACAGAEELAAQVRAAGTVVFGSGASVSFGDYASGANHVLPTGRRARAHSGLGVADFLRWQSWQRIDPQGAADLSPVVERLATLEGLPGHAAAARIAGRMARGRLAMPEARPPDLEPPIRAAVAIRGARRYDPGTRKRPVELSDNTNLFGTAPTALAVLQGAGDGLVRPYPSVYGDALKAALATDLGVGPECVATGCGSDDLLDSAFRAFAGPGGRIAFSEPTFSMVREFATVNGASRAPVPTDESLAPDLDALAGTGADLVYVCRPDNPSGMLVPERQVLDLVERFPGTVLVDEAYIHFADRPSLAARAAVTPGLLVLRTFSKAWGLAGMRVGFAVGAPGWIETLERARGPYKLNALAEQAAVAALREDGDWLADTVRRARKAREILRGELRARGLRVWPSAANFLLFRAGGVDAVPLAAALAEQGVGVRPFPDVPGGGAVRVTVGPEETMQRFLASLDRASSRWALGPEAAR